MYILMPDNHYLLKKAAQIKSIDDLKKEQKYLLVKGSTSAINIREKAPDATSS